MMLNLTNLCGFGNIVSTVASNPLDLVKWNPSDRYDATLEVSLNDTKVYTTQVSAWKGIRCTHYVPPGAIGKFEIRCVDGVGSYTDSSACGVSILSAGLYNANSTLKGDSGHYLIGHSSNGYGVGDYLGFKVDRVANTLYVYKNGVSFTSFAIPATDNLYPLGQLLGGVCGFTIQGNEASFVYAIP